MAEKKHRDQASGSTSDSLFRSRRPLEIAYRRGKTIGIVLTIDHPKTTEGYKKEPEEKNMERQLIQKAGARPMSRSSLSQAQSRPSKPSEFANSDRPQSDQSLLVSTARKIGSVLGKLVAKTEKSLSPRKPGIELALKKKNDASRSRKASVKRGSSEAGSKRSRLKVVNKSQLKSIDSVRHSPSRNVKRKSRAENLASRTARSDQG